MGDWLGQVTYAGMLLEEYLTRVRNTNYQTTNPLHPGISKRFLDLFEHALMSIESQTPTEKQRAAYDCVEYHLEMVSPEKANGKLQESIEDLISVLEVLPETREFSPKQVLNFNLLHAFVRKIIISGDEMGNSLTPIRERAHAERYKYPEEPTSDPQHHDICQS